MNPSLATERGVIIKDRPINSQVSPGIILVLLGVLMFGHIPLIALSVAIRMKQRATSSCSPKSMPWSINHFSYSADRIALLIQQGAT
jgi:hypothetical protein